MLLVIFDVQIEQLSDRHTDSSPHLHTAPGFPSVTSLLSHLGEEGRTCLGFDISQSSTELRFPYNQWPQAFKRMSNNYRYLKVQVKKEGFPGIYIIDNKFFFRNNRITNLL